MIFLVILTIFTVIIFIYHYFKNAYSYWEKKDIHAIKPKYIFGNLTDIIFLKKPFNLLHKELYFQSTSHKIVGMYTMGKPELMIRDPELIKIILVKDFYYFYNRPINIYPKIEPKANQLSTMRDEEWRNLRIKLSGTFTTGKMKMMLSLVKSCVDDLDYFVSQQSTQGKCIDITDLSMRFSTDIIGRCAFGIETSCLKNLDSKFYKMGRDVFEFSFRKFIRFLFPNIHPTLIKLFKMKFFSVEVEDFFTSLVENTVQYREKNNIKRNDFLDSLISLKNNTEVSEQFKHEDDQQDFENLTLGIRNDQIKSNIDMNLDLMVSQALMFFTGGSETTAKTFNNVIFEIARNSDIQKKMRDEIFDVFQKYNSIFCYDLLKELTYMDMVLAETMRKYPTVVFLQRECKENYKIPNTSTIIEKGITIYIPILGLHSDEQYYEFPDKFYPEHFTKEAIAKRPQFAYIPFGAGPRVCIAERFAKMVIKVALFYLLKNYEFSLSPKMKTDLLEYAKGLGLLSPVSNMWVSFKNINL